MAIDKKTKELIRFLRDMQGSRQYKGGDTLGKQYLQEVRENKKLKK